jgi:hypothetical protein
MAEYEDHSQCTTLIVRHAFVSKRQRLHQQGMPEYKDCSQYILRIDKGYCSWTLNAAFRIDVWM